MTGEKEAFSWTRSISLATRMSPLWMTVRVTESSSIASHRHDQVAPLVDPRARARVDQGRRVELLDQRRAVEPLAGPEPLAPVDRRLEPAAVDVDPAGRRRGLAAGRPVPGRQPAE